MGPFVEAWIRVHGNTTAARGKAHERFLEPMLAELDRLGFDHLYEIADG